MKIPVLKARFHQLCNLEFPTANDVPEAQEIGQELIAARETAADEVVMTAELIYGRIQRLVTRRRMNSPTPEEAKESTQAAYEFELAFMPDDGVRH